MKTLILQRETTGDEGTFGTFTIPGDGTDPDVVFRSGELPWRGNKPMISCFPSGLYEVRHDLRHGKTDVYELQNVHGRTDCQIHSGNFCGDEALGWVTHVKGCLLLGRAKGYLRNNKGVEQQAVTASVSAIEAFQEIMRWEPFLLDVRDIPGENWGA